MKRKFAVMSLALSVAFCAQHEESEKEIVRPEAAGVAYMNSLAGGRGDPVPLDFADDRQNDFVRKRLAAAGVTPEDYPGFFEQLKRLRTRGAQMSTARPLSDRGHEIVNLQLKEERAKAAAHSTVKGGANFSYLDLRLYDQSWRALGKPEKKIEFGGGGTDLFATASNPYIDEEGRCILASSLSCTQPKDGPFQCTFESSLRHSCQIAVRAVLKEPQDVNGDGEIRICLARSDSDCDVAVENIDGKKEIKFPLKGYADFLYPIVLDEKWNKAEIFLSRKDEGGKCDAKKDIINEAFWKSAERVPGKHGPASRLKWDLKLADFGKQCFEQLERVNFFMKIHTKVAVMDLSGLPPGVLPFSFEGGFETFKPASVFLASAKELNQGRTRLDNPLPKFSFRYSCFAAGTLIRMADGSLRPAENVRRGDRVLGPDGRSRTVADRTRGTEPDPMVLLTEEGGKSVLLTAGHPVIAPDGRAVLAKELKAGDRVRTAEGVSRLVRVERESYRGLVYNFRLEGANATKTKDGRLITADGAALFYAGGFLIGDSRLQAAAETLAGKRAPARVAPEWRVDYESWRYSQLNWFERRLSDLKSVWKGGKS